MQKRFLFILPILAISLGCSLSSPVQISASPTILTSTPYQSETPSPIPSETASATPEPTATVLKPGDIIYFEDFSNPESGWDRVRDDSRVTDYENGSYRMWLNEIQRDMWANPDLTFPFPVRLEVYASKAAGPDDNAFGLICHYQDIGNFYYGEISSDGFAIIGKVQDGQSSYLSAEEMQPVEGINLGDAGNQIRLDCVNGAITLYANNQVVAQATDNSFSGGNVGLQVSSFDDVSVEILFDNFLVVIP